MERDALVIREVYDTIHFNSHAHVERDQFTTSFPHKKLNFNSHAHVERDIWGGIKVKSYEISTHTLTWSVTLEGEPATMQNVNFNSHAHVERDLPVIIVYHVI